MKILCRWYQPTFRAGFSLSAQAFFFFFCTGDSVGVGYCLHVMPRPVGPLLFLLYINNLHRSVKHSKTYHFADDTNIMQSNKSLDVLSQNLNKDPKSLLQWLKANKLSLNISKTKLIIFHRNTASIDHTLKLKLDGKKLSPSQSVKYLGVLSDGKTRLLM